MVIKYKTSKTFERKLVSENIIFRELRLVRCSSVKSVNSFRELLAEGESESSIPEPDFNGLFLLTLGCVGQTGSTVISTRVCLHSEAITAR